MYSNNEKLLRESYSPLWYSVPRKIIMNSNCIITITKFQPTFWQNILPEVSEQCFKTCLPQEGTHKQVFVLQPSLWNISFLTNMSDILIYYNNNEIPTHVLAEYIARGV